MYLKNKFLFIFLAATLVSGCSAFQNGFLGFAPAGDKKEYVRARNLYNQQNYEQAVSELTGYIYKAGNVKRREARAYRLLGMSYEQLGRLDKALDTYSEALEFHPKHVPLLLAAASLYQRAGLLDQSQEFYQRALQEEPTNSTALAGMAENYRAFGFYSQARAYYDQFFALNPAASPVHRARYASTFLNQQNYEQAFIHITMALAEENANPDYWALSARALTGLGKLPEALTQWNTALSLAPNRKDLQFYKAFNLYQQQRYADSLQVAQHILKTAPQDPLSLFISALNEWALHRKTLARQHLRQAAQFAPANSFVGRVATRLLTEWQ